jgi:hypothetical protein
MHSARLPKKSISPSASRRRPAPSTQESTTTESFRSSRTYSPTRSNSALRKGRSSSACRQSINSFGSRSETSDRGSMRRISSGSSNAIGSWMVRMRPDSGSDSSSRNPSSRRTAGRSGRRASSERGVRSSLLFPESMGPCGQRRPLPRSKLSGFLSPAERPRADAGLFWVWGWEHLQRIPCVGEALFSIAEGRMRGSVTHRRVDKGPPFR